MQGNVIVTNRDFRIVVFKKVTVILDSYVKDNLVQGNFYPRIRFVTRSTRLTTRGIVPACSTRSSTCNTFLSTLVLICPFVVLVCPLVVSVCLLVVLVVLSVSVNLLRTHSNICE